MLPKAYRTAILLTFALLVFGVLGLRNFALAQSSSDQIRSRASYSVPGIVDGLNQLIVGGPGQFESGALGQTAHLIALPYGHPIASGFAYVARLKNNFKLTQSAYAAGQPPAESALLGFSGLLPVLPLWTLFRNIAYLGFVLIFIVIGFMIMFRVKIDPRTVASVQQAIPSIVVGLLLVTFSYAIVGFAIDLMNLIIAFMVQLFVQQGVLQGSSIDQQGVLHSAPAQDTLFNSNLLQMAQTFWGTGVSGAAGAVGSVVDQIVGDVFGGVVGKLAGFITSGVMTLVFMIALLYAAIRTFLSMIIAYVSVIILTILGPLQIMIGVLPGQSGIGFSKWIRNIAGNLALFPLVAFLILLAAILTGGGGSNFGIRSESPVKPLGLVQDPKNVLWQPPLLFGGINNFEDIQGLVGLGIFLLMPAAGKMVQDAFKTGGFGYGAAIGSTVGAGGAVVGAPLGLARTATSEAAKDIGATRVRQTYGRIFGKKKEEPKEL